MPSDVLRHAHDPFQAGETLAPAPAVAPHAGESTSDRGKTVVAPIAGSLPTFGTVSQSYIDMRIAADGEEHPDIKYLRLRRQTLLDLIGDRLVNEYYPRDLQEYVNLMQFWPANATKRAAFAGINTREIIEANCSLAERPLRRKTLSDGYVANIRTMMRHGMADYRYSDPFAGAGIRWPGVLQASMPPEAIGADVLDRVFRTGVETGRLVEAMMPLLSALTGRRPGVLLYLRGEDLREKHGVVIAQTGGIVFDGGRRKRAPIKTDESATYFVLHEFLTQIGFSDWARAQNGWVFAEAHLHGDPSKRASKTLNRHLRRGGAVGGDVEVFHSFRGDAIDRLRDNKLHGRTARLQTGHELGDVHERYGHRALDAAERKRLATLPLPQGIDWSVFHELDFNALAAARRGGNHGSTKTKNGSRRQHEKQRQGTARAKRKPA